MEDEKQHRSIDADVHIVDRPYRANMIFVVVALLAIAGLLAFAYALGRWFDASPKHRRLS